MRSLCVWIVEWIVCAVLCSLSHELMCATPRSVGALGTSFKANAKPLAKSHRGSRLSRITVIHNVFGVTLVWDVPFIEVTGPRSTVHVWQFEGCHDLFHISSVRGRHWWNECEVWRFTHVPDFHTDWNCPLRKFASRKIADWLLSSPTSLLFPLCRSYFEGWLTDVLPGCRRSTWPGSAFGTRSQARIIGSYGFTLYDCVGWNEQSSLVIQIQKHALPHIHPKHFPAGILKSVEVAVFPSSRKFWNSLWNNTEKNENKNGITGAQLQWVQLFAHRDPLPHTHISPDLRVRLNLVFVVATNSFLLFI